MEWRVNGNVLIACNCDYGCPCNFNARPTRGDCEGGWIWAIESGSIDGVDVGGLGVALYADWPGAIHEGNGRATCFIDERASEQQYAALDLLLRGRIGGPWGIFINTYSLSGPQPARFDLHFNEYNTRVRIADVIHLEIETIRNPVTNAESHPEVVLPEGMVTKHGKLARSKVFHVKGDVAYDHSGHYAAFGKFNYASS